jgi:hypothetical protein
LPNLGYARFEDVPEVSLVTDVQFSFTMWGFLFLEEKL